MEALHARRILDFHFYKQGSLMLYYGCREVDNPSERGMCEVDETSKALLASLEVFTAPGDLLR